MSGEPQGNSGDVAPIADRTWQVAAASVCGTSHRRCEMPCQDAHAWEILPSGAIAIAVADGAGSAVHSDRGSQVAVETAVSLLRDRAGELLAWVTAEVGEASETQEHREADESVDTDDVGESDSGESQPDLETIAREIFDGVLIALAETGERESWELPELATTLVAVVADRAGVVAIQVGDGAAIVSDADGNAVTITAPDNGEYANETVFVTSQRARDRLQVATDRKSTRLNSSHQITSYAVFCLKKKNHPYPCPRNRSP